jgi:hypothetical protein
VGKPDGKKLLGRLRCRWVDNIKMDLTDIGCGGMDWIDLAQDRKRRAIMNTGLNLGALYNFWKFLSSCTTVGFSRTVLLRVSWILYLS